MKLYLKSTFKNYVKFSKTFRTVKYLTYYCSIRKESAIYEREVNRITTKDVPRGKQLNSQIQLKTVWKPDRKMCSKGILKTFDKLQKTFMKH